MSLAHNAALMINAKGETMTLRRAGEADITVKAKRGDLSTETIAGTFEEAALSFWIANSEIAISPAPTRYPRQGDSLAAADGAVYRILACDTRKDGETIAFHILTVAGS